MGKSVLEDLQRRFTVLADHYPIAGHATRHDEATRAYGEGYSHAWREAAEYLRDALVGIAGSSEEE